MWLKGYTRDLNRRRKRRDRSQAFLHLHSDQFAVRGLRREVDVAERVRAYFVGNLRSNDLLDQIRRIPERIAA